MITHTEADKSFFAIMDGQPTYPFHFVLSLNQGRLPVLEAIGQLFVYFKHLKEREIKDFDFARKCFFTMITFVPEHVFRYDRNYQRLYDYFTQGLNYTPLNVLSHPPVFFAKTERLF